MFGKRVKNALKKKIALTIFVVLLVIIAFANFFILLSLETAGYHKRLLESVFFIHIRQNLTVTLEQNAQNTSVDLRKNWSQNENKEKSNGTRRILRNNLPTAELNERTYILTRSHSEKKRLISTTPHGELRKLEKAHGSLPVSPNCTAWCHRGNGLKPPYFITAVLLVRIYRSDLAKLSSREMIQWLQYLRYAGFQHVYVYDAYVERSESQHEVFKPFIQSGYVTYVDWSIHNPYSIQGTQVAAYQDCIDKYGADSTWQAAIDIDEYPFSPTDLNENFISRFLVEYSRKNPDVSEITMKNYLFLGKPIDDAIEPLLIARIRRRTHEPANALVKPIYKPANLAWAQVHHNGIKRGNSRDSPALMLRMNHYWGARLQNWGDDTPKVLKMTQPDYTIKNIVRKIKECMSCLGKDAMFLQRWA